MTFVQQIWNKACVCSKNTPNKWFTLHVHNSIRIIYLILNQIISYFSRKKAKHTECRTCNNMFETILEESQNWQSMICSTVRLWTQRLNVLQSCISLSELEMGSLCWGTFDSKFPPLFFPLLLCSTSFCLFFPRTSTPQRALHLPQQTDWTSKEVSCIKTWNSYPAALSLRPLSLEGDRWPPPLISLSAVCVPQ